MRVAVEHVFTGVTCDSYEQLYFDELFNAAVAAATNLGRRLVRLDRTEHRIVRHAWYERAPQPGGPGRKAFGPAPSRFREEMDYDCRSHTGRWRIIPDRFSDRVRSSGTIEIAPVRGGVRRTLRGEVSVALFGFGRRIERMIVAEIENSHAAQAAFTTRWLAGRG